MTSLLLLKSLLFAKSLQKRRKRKRKDMKSTKQKTCIFNICRVCTKETANIPIFENNQQLNIAEEIKYFSGVTIEKLYNLSNHICESCLNLLKGCISFRDLCQRNSKKFLEIDIKKEYEPSDLTNERSRVQTEERNDIPSPDNSEENLETWSCSICSKDFVDLLSYSEHLRKCQSEGIPRQCETNKTFLCDICGKTAKSNANLQVHMGIHENVFPFKCDACPYKGRTMDLLKVHKRVHLTDKPYKCTMCPKSATTASNLSKHMRHVHSKNRPYKCTFCDKGFTSRHDMNRHVRDIHLRQGTVECDICGKKFNTKKILQGHRWKIHKIKAERHGRLPSYLQCQAIDKSDGKVVTDKENDHIEELT